jgi:hypothetical protein
LLRVRRDRFLTSPGKKTGEFFHCAGTPFFQRKKGAHQHHEQHDEFFHEWAFGSEYAPHPPWKGRIPDRSAVGWKKVSGTEQAKFKAPDTLQAEGCLTIRSGRFVGDEE